MTSTASSLVNVVLKQATWEQFRKSTMDNYIEWGQLLTRDQYWQREVESKEHIIGHRPWVLVKSNDNQEEEIVASCETYEMDGYYCNLKQEEFKVVPVKAQSVASVFVEEKYRGKGYATQLMKQLNSIVKNEPERSAFVDLYSDIDPRVYEKCGWYIYPATSVYINNDFEYPANLKPSTNANLEPINESNVDSIITLIDFETIQLFKDQFNQIKQEKKDQELSYIIGKRLSGSQLIWHIRQVQTYARCLDIKPFPTVFGYQLTSSSSSEDVGGYIVWVHDVRDNHLNILCISSKNQQSFNILLEKAIQEAKLYNLKDVQMWWNGDSRYIKQEYLDALNLSPSVRDGSVPMVCSFLNDDPKDRKDNTNQCKWINIYKFGWI